LPTFAAFGSDGEKPLTNNDWHRAIIAFADRSMPVVPEGHGQNIRPDLTKMAWDIEYLQCRLKLIETVLSEIFRGRQD
jgi:hypothetical protein